MAVIEIKTQGAGSDESFEAYPSDTYFCKVVSADLVESKKFFDKVTGDPKKQIKMVWEVFRLTPEQDEAGLEIGKWFFQYHTPYYGQTRNGDSLFTQFIDKLREQGHLAEFDPTRKEIDTDWFVGIEQRVAVDEVKRDDGTTTNKVKSVMPLRVQRRAPAAAPAPAQRRNAPQPATPANTRPAPRNDDPLFEGEDD